MEDIAQLFALEVKQELANRYFGFRKQIEDDINNYQARLGAAGKEYINLIAEDLQIIRSELGTEALFGDFLDLLNYPKVIVARIIKDYGGQRRDQPPPPAFSLMGLTKRQRQRHRFFRIYKEFRQHTLQQHELFATLQDEYNEICDQIHKFYRQNDINSILSFLRQIDSHPDQYINAPPEQTLVARQKSLEDDLRIVPPPPVESAVMALAPPPDLEQLKTKLVSLLNRVSL